MGSSTPTEKMGRGLAENTQTKLLAQCLSTIVGVMADRILLRSNPSIVELRKENTGVFYYTIMNSYGNGDIISNRGIAGVDMSPRFKPRTLGALRAVEG